MENKTNKTAQMINGEDKCPGEDAAMMPGVSHYNSENEKRVYGSEILNDAHELFGFSIEELQQCANISQAGSSISFGGFQPSTTQDFENLDKPYELSDTNEGEPPKSEKLECNLFRLPLNKQCVACGDRRHVKERICVSCKYFSARRAKGKKCIENGACQVNVLTRGKCEGCRMDKIKRGSKYRKLQFDSQTFESINAIDIHYLVYNEKTNLRSFTKKLRMMMPTDAILKHNESLMIKHDDREFKKRTSEHEHYCPICGELFENDGDWVRHRLTSDCKYSDILKNNSNCFICLKNYKSLKSHFRYHKTYKCPLCFVPIRAMSVHLTRVRHKIST
jgi:hypothetical protein